LYIVLKFAGGGEVDGVGDGDGCGDETLKLTVLQLIEELNPWFNPGRATIGDIE
jgi:hypothetical protein